MSRAAFFAVASIVSLACAPTPASPTVVATADASPTNASADAESVQSAPNTADAAAPSEEIADAEAAPEPAPVPVVAADAGEKTAGIIAPQRAATGSRPASLQDALGNTANGSHRTAASAPSSDAPFDRGAVVSALRGVKLDACKTKDGPTGSGRISITFAPNGQATTTKIEDPPYAGTATAKCVEAKFRAVRVPRFDGSATTVKFPFKLD